MIFLCHCNWCSQQGSGSYYQNFLARLASILLEHWSATHGYCKSSDAFSEFVRPKDRLLKSLGSEVLPNRLTAPLPFSECQAAIRSWLICDCGGLSFSWKFIRSCSLFSGGSREVWRGGLEDLDVPEMGAMLSAFRPVLLMFPIKSDASYRILRKISLAILFLPKIKFPITRKCWQMHLNSLKLVFAYSSFLQVYCF